MQFLNNNVNNSFAINTIGNQKSPKSMGLGCKLFVGFNDYKWAGSLVEENSNLSWGSFILFINFKD